MRRFDITQIVHPMNEFYDEYGKWQLGVITDPENWDECDNSDCYDHETEENNCNCDLHCHVMVRFNGCTAATSETEHEIVSNPDDF